MREVPGSIPGAAHVDASLLRRALLRPYTSRAASLEGPRGVTVSTLDSESSDRGSNPREAFQCPAAPCRHDSQVRRNEGREIRTPNLLIWSQTRYRCAIPPVEICAWRLPYPTALALSPAGAAMKQTRV